MPIRWINAGRVNHIRSQSIYHGLAYAQTPDTPNTVVVVTPEDPYICIGYFQDVTKEVDLNFCHGRELPVFRRETGGGTVYIDSGQMFVQWVFQPGFLPRKIDQRFLFFNKALIETYKFFGINAYHYPVNDVHVDGKKIVGTGAATIGEAEVITGNFLFDFDIEIMTQTLNIPNQLFRERLRANLNNYMTWMKRELNTVPAYKEVADIYKLYCESTLGESFYEGEFSKLELDAIAQSEAKLSNNQWLHAVKSPPAKNRIVKIHAGVWLGWIVFEKIDFTIQVFSELANSRIENIRIHLPPTLSPEWKVGKLEKALTNTPYMESSVRKKLGKFFDGMSLKEALLSVDEWTEVIMQLKKEINRIGGHV